MRACKYLEYEVMSSELGGALSCYIFSFPQEARACEAEEYM